MSLKSKNIDMKCLRDRKFTVQKGTFQSAPSFKIEALLLIRTGVNDARQALQYPTRLKSHSPLGSLKGLGYLVAYLVAYLIGLATTAAMNRRNQPSNHQFNSVSSSSSSRFL